jgi:chromosome segregation protein
MLRVAVSKTEKRIAELQDEISGLAIRRETTDENRRGIEIAISDARGARDKAQNEIAAARAAGEAGRKNLELLKATLQASQENLRQHRLLLTDAEKDLAEIERALVEKESRLEILRQLNEEGEGLGQGSQAVLKGLDDPARIHAALGGALVSNLDVDSEYVAAIEAALGRNLQAIVLKDAGLAPAILAKLNEKKFGQAALALPSLSNYSPKTQTALPRKALAWANDKVKAPESLAPLVTRLLGNVAVFGDLEEALSFKKDKHNLAAATLTGEFISAEGVVFGGSRETSTDSLLQRKAQMAGLNTECADVRRQRDALLQKRDEANAALEKATSKLEKARRQYDSADRERSAFDNRIPFLERELQENEQKIDQLRSEQMTLAQQIQAADERIAKLEEELDSERANLEAQQKQQLEIQAAQGKAATREAEATEQLHELRLAVATEQQRHESLIAQRQPMSAREAELAEMIATRRAEIADFEKRKIKQADESKKAESAIEKQSRQRADLEVALRALTSQRAERSAAANETESSLRGVRHSLNELHDLRSKQQVRESQLQMQIDNVAERISRRYQVNLRDFALDQGAFDKTLRAQIKRHEKLEGEAAPDSRELAAPDVEKVIAELTRQLDNMGPVNLDAVHEYDELEERYKFLEGQNNDLTNARRELLDVIAQINSTTRKLFAETFAEVRVNFREMFAELFGGGRADLSLLDENDSLNCGIEISARPPGKQLQSVSLLSGGERSMVAVALLFAIYMVRSSPFCILDEVDAAMDEGNINRFIRVLERFVKQSQFIIMTHNKRTIAKADVLYGVTMEERGVSKLVGMKLTAPQQISSEVASNGDQQEPSQRRLALATR